jgi:predicted nucleotide-binding protein
MATEFKGTVEALRERIDESRIGGKCSGQGQAKLSFRSDEGAVLNFWPSTGTLQFQGREDAVAALEKAVSVAFPLPIARPADSPVPSLQVRQIFIVHGHDVEARDQLELAFRRLGLEPFVLMNMSGGGKTIIEALEGKIGRDYSSDFLMTPDDMGTRRRMDPTASSHVPVRMSFLRPGCCFHPLRESEWPW